MNQNPFSSYLLFETSGRVESILPITIGDKWKTKKLERLKLNVTKTANLLDKIEK